MAEFVSDCPRCGAKHTTMDAHSSIVRSIAYNWKAYLEIACLCRVCKKFSIQIVSKKSTDSSGKFFGAIGSCNTLITYNGPLNDLVSYEGLITIKDLAVQEPPDHLNDQIRNVVFEANRCLSSGCWNASASMYRLALDLATKGFLPPGDVPNQKIRRSLGLRLAWLFENGLLPRELQELAECLKEDGNDGAHDGTLEKADAEDLHDFTYRLLDRLYSEPARLRIATERRAERRKID